MSTAEQVARAKEIREECAKQGIGNEQIVAAIIIADAIAGVERELDRVHGQLDYMTDHWERR